jgi:hypothetical protein
MPRRLGPLLADKHSRFTICECGKRLYRSEHAARADNCHARFRLFIYWCEGGRGFHVSNPEKEGGRFKGRDSR